MSAGGDGPMLPYIPMVPGESLTPEPPPARGAKPPQPEVEEPPAADPDALAQAAAQAPPVPEDLMAQARRGGANPTLAPMEPPLSPPLKVDAAAPVAPPSPPRYEPPAPPKAAPKADSRPAPQPLPPPGVTLAPVPSPLSELPPPKKAPPKLSELPTVLHDDAAEAETEQMSAEQAFFDEVPGGTLESEVGGALGGIDLTDEWDPEEAPVLAGSGTPWVLVIGAVVVLGVVGVALAGAAFVMLSGGDETPEAAAPKAPVEAPVSVEEPEAPAEPAKVEAAAPAETAPEPAPTPKPVKKATAKPKPRPAAKSEPAPSKPEIRVSRPRITPKAAEPETDAVEPPPVETREDGSMVWAPFGEDAEKAAEPAEEAAAPLEAPPAEPAPSEPAADPDDPWGVNP